jgi:hypothetical protein
MERETRCEIEREVGEMKAMAERGMCGKGKLVEEAICRKDE